MQIRSFVSMGIYKIVHILLDSGCGYIENCKYLIMHTLIVSIIFNIVINSSRGIIKRKLDLG